jgi:hypothetical protein
LKGLLALIPLFEGVDAAFYAADGVVAFEGALIPLLRRVDSPKAKTGCGTQNLLSAN